MNHPVGPAMRATTQPQTIAFTPQTPSPIWGFYWVAGPHQRRAAAAQLVNSPTNATLSRKRWYRKVLGTSQAATTPACERPFCVDSSLSGSSREDRPAIPLRSRQRLFVV
jgi:hypothetical protein